MIEKLTLKKLIRTRLPSAISSRLMPMLSFGCAALIFAVIVCFIPSVRKGAPLIAVMGMVAAAYSLWQKAEVLKTGYDEYLFKVVDYTYWTPVISRISKPTGMILLNKTPGIQEDQQMYHVAVAGKANSLPPIDWIIRVYVPKGIQAADYGDTKYFPVVYGYKIEGEYPAVRDSQK